jgi:hypothetical protein
MIKKIVQLLKKPAGIVASTCWAAKPPKAFAREMGRTYRTPQ